SKIGGNFFLFLFPSFPFFFLSFFLSFSPFLSLPPSFSSTCGLPASLPSPWLNSPFLSPLHKYLLHAKNQSPHISTLFPIPLRLNQFIL
uniref:Uncharacterized protein n=1 Tax=Oryza brachyantha TaxID=4533 RepID=J3LCD2_ORYBR